LWEFSGGPPLPLLWPLPHLELCPPHLFNASMRKSIFFSFFIPPSFGLPSLS
jgi:hypothetical protein